MESPFYLPFLFLRLVTYLEDGIVIPCEIDFPYKKNRDSIPLLLLKYNLITYLSYYYLLPIFTVNDIFAKIIFYSIPFHGRLQT